MKESDTPPSEERLLKAAEELVRKSEPRADHDSEARDRQLFKDVWAPPPRRSRRAPWIVLVAASAVGLGAGLLWMTRPGRHPDRLGTHAPVAGAPARRLGKEDELLLPTGGRLSVVGEGAVTVAEAVRRGAGGTLTVAPGTVWLRTREADGTWEVKAGPFSGMTGEMDGTVSWNPAGRLEVAVNGGSLQLRGPLLVGGRTVHAGQGLSVDVAAGTLQTRRIDQSAGQAQTEDQPSSPLPRRASALAESPGASGHPSSTTWSHWAQPWRAVRLTPAASRMRAALGITVSPTWEDATVLPPLLAKGGFARVSLALPWSTIDYDHPDELTAPDRVSKPAWMRSLREQGLRPLFVLHSHRSVPTPLRAFTTQLLEAVPAGARQMKLDPAALPLIVPGRTGLDSPGTAADVLLVDAPPDGIVHLSKPLLRSLSAGPVKLTTLRYAPFQPPRLANGKPNPVFDETMSGWLSYVRAVCDEARAIFGPAGFDLQVWNDGTTFFDSRNYYQPPLATVEEVPGTAIVDEVVSRTARWLTDPRNDLPGVRLIDGLSSTATSGEVPPAGVHAVARTVVVNVRRYPAETLDGRPWLDADGRPNGGLNADGIWVEAFKPHYDAAFPEVGLSALPGRDPLLALALGGEGRHPGLWLTSFNLNPRTASLGTGSSFNLDESWRFRTKATLRALSAFVGVGIESVFFYTARQRDVGLVDPRDPDTGGEVLRSLRRFVDAFDETGEIATPRTLHLERAEGCADCVEFVGGARPGAPALTHTDLVALFPFQTDDASFVAPVYVMTRSLARPRRDEGPRRFDLPEKSVRLTVSGLRGEATRAWASDPVDGQKVPVRIVSRELHAVTVEMPLTDSPRLLRLTDAPPASP